MNQGELPFPETSAPLQIISGAIGGALGEKRGVRGNFRSIKRMKARELQKLALKGGV